MNTITLALVTAGPFTSWFVAARYLFCRWIKNDTFNTSGERRDDRWPACTVTVMAMVAALFWPMALIVAGIMHNAPKSRAVLAEEIAALELENNRLRHEEWKRGGPGWT